MPVASRIGVRHGGLGPPAGVGAPLPDTYSFMDRQPSPSPPLQPASGALGLPGLAPLQPRSRRRQTVAAGDRHQSGERLPGGQPHCCGHHVLPEPLQAGRSHAWATPTCSPAPATAAALSGLRTPTAWPPRLLAPNPALAPTPANSRIRTLTQLSPPLWPQGRHPGEPCSPLAPTPPGPVHQPQREQSHRPASRGRGGEKAGAGQGRGWRRPGGRGGHSSFRAVRQGWPAHRAWGRTWAGDHKRVGAARHVATGALPHT